MVDDAARRNLFEALESNLGPGPATTLMELLPPVGWADVARRSDFVAVRGEMAGMRGELKAAIAALRTELKAEIADGRVEIAELRVEVRSTADRQFARLLVANVPLMFGTAGLVLAAAKLT